VDETKQTLVWNRLESLRLKQLGLEQVRKFDLKKHVNRSPLYIGDQPAWTAGLPTLRQPQKPVTAFMLPALSQRSMTMQSDTATLTSVSQVLRAEAKRQLADNARMRSLIISNNRVAPFNTLDVPDPEAPAEDGQALSPRRDFRRLRLSATGVLPCDVTSWRSRTIANK
jgi:hypothetical protein